MLSSYGAQDNFCFEQHKVGFYKFAENKKYIFVFIVYGFDLTSSM